MQLAADDAQAARHVRRALAHLVLLGDVVEVEPLAVAAADDALRAHDLAVVAGIQRGEDALKLRRGEGFRRLDAPAREDLVRVVPVMMVVMRVMLMTVLIVVVVMAALVFVVIVMVVAAFVFVIVIVMVMAVLVPVFIVVVVVMAAAVGIVRAP